MKYALDQGFQPEQVVIITDTGENTHPILADVAGRCVAPPEFIFIVVPTRDRGGVVDQLKGAGHRVEVFEIRDPRDYWVYDQVAALLIDPAKAAELAEAMVAILENESLGDSLKAKGLDRIKRYTWKRAATEAGCSS